MPLIGKLGQGRLYALLDETLQGGKEALLEFQSPNQAATLHVRDGKVQHVAHEHHQIDDVLSTVNQWEEGLFFIYDREEKANSTVAPLWLLVPDSEQLGTLRDQLTPLGFPLWSICYPHELPGLLQQFNPPVLIVTSDSLSALPKSLFAEQANKPYESRLRLLCLGPPPSHFQGPTSLTLEVLPWPTTPTALHQAVRSLLTNSQPPLKAPYQKISSTPSLGDDPTIQLLAALTPTLPDDLCLHIHPSHREKLESLDIAPSWRKWLLTLDHNYPVSNYLEQSPGNQEQVRVMLRYLLYLGILTTHNPLYSLLQPSQQALPTQNDVPLHVSRIVTIGLRGQWKEDWIFSLQQLSQQMSVKVPRKASVHIPYLPKSELARIPLPNDSLLLFYGLLNVEKLDTMLDKIGGTVDGFLFFVDASHEAEVTYAQESRQVLLSKHMVPYVVMLTQLGVAPSSSEVERLRLSPQERLVPISKLDESATNRVLYQLLQQFPQHRHLIPPPSSAK